MSNTFKMRSLERLMLTLVAQISSSTTIMALVRDSSITSPSVSYTSSMRMRKRSGLPRQYPIATLTCRRI
jgi:hypothetical protein